MTADQHGPGASWPGLPPFPVFRSCGDLGGLHSFPLLFLTPPLPMPLDPSMNLPDLDPAGTAEQS